MDCRQTYADAIGVLKQEVTTQEFEDIKRLVDRFDSVMREYGLSARGALDDFANGNITNATQALDRLVANAIEQEAKQVTRESVTAFRNAQAQVSLFERLKSIAAQDKTSVSDAQKRTRALSEIIATGYKNRLSLENTTNALKAQWTRQAFLQRIEKELGVSWTKALADENTKIATVQEYFKLAKGKNVDQPDSAAAKLAKIVYDVRSEQRAQLAALGSNSARADSLPISFDWSRIQPLGRDAFAAKLAQALSEKTHGDMARRTAIASDIWTSLERNKGVIDWQEIGDLQPRDGNIQGDYEARPVLDFENADGWISFNNEYGRKDILDTIYSDIDYSAGREALVRMFGPNPDRNFAELLHKAQLDENGRVDLSAAHLAARTQAYYQRLTKVSVPEWMRFAQLNTAGRALNTASDLGGAVIAGIVDLPTQIYAAKAFYDVPVWKAIRDTMSGAFSKADRERAAYLGTFAEGISNNIANRFGGNMDSFDKWSRGSSTLANWTLRLSGLELWTSAWKSGGTNVLSRHLGDFVQKGVKFDQLPKHLRGSLERFEISANEWNGFGTQHLDANGRFEPLSIGQTAGAEFSTQQKMTAWFIDQVESMVLSPGVRDRNYSVLTFDPASNVGQAVASMTQFMSFPIAFGRKLMARTMWGNDDGALAAAQNAAALMLVTTMVGGIVVQTREMLQGRKPYNWTDGDFILKSVQAGGGFGIVSDQILKFGGEEALKALANSDERSIANMTSLLGPLYSDIMKILEGTISAGGHALHGDEDKAFKDLNQVSQTVLRSVPGRSIWYLAAAYRAAVLDNVSYALDPAGYRQAQHRVWGETKGRAESWFDMDRPSRNVGWVGETVQGLRN